MIKSFLLKYNIIEALLQAVILSESPKTVPRTAGHDSGKRNKTFGYVKAKKYSELLNSSLPFLLSPLCPSPYHVCLPPPSLSGFLLGGVSVVGPMMRNVVVT